MVYLLETSNPVTYVKGTSMLPVLRDGDLIFLRGTTAQEIARDFQAGDRDIILVFWSTVYQTDTIHRVIAVEYDSEGNIIGFRTQGDNNPGPDFGIAKEQDIIGRVVYHISYLGYLPIFFGSTAGRAISGAIIVLLVIWTAVDERKRRMGQAQHADKAPSLELYIGVYIDVPGRL